MGEIITIITTARSFIIMVAIPLGGLILTFSGLLFMVKRNYEALAFAKSAGIGIVIMGLAIPITKLFGKLVGIC